MYLSCILLVPQTCQALARWGAQIRWKREHNAKHREEAGLVQVLHRVGEKTCCAWDLLQHSFSYIRGSSLEQNVLLLCFFRCRLTQLKLCCILIQLSQPKFSVHLCRLLIPPIALMHIPASPGQIRSPYSPVLQFALLLLLLHLGPLTQVNPTNLIQ